MGLYTSKLRFPEPASDLVLNSMELEIPLSVSSAS